MMQKMKRTALAQARQRLSGAMPLVWQAAAGCGGFVLAGGTVFGALHPFGLALVLGAQGNTLYMAAAGAAMGSFLLLPQLTAVRYLGALAAALAGRLLARGKGGFWPAALGGSATLLLVQLMLSMAGAAGPVDALAALGDVVLSVGFGFAMRCAKGRTAAGILPYGLALAASAQQFAVGFFQPGLFLLCVAGLITANRGRVRDTAVLCVACGAALCAASPELSFGVMGVAAGCVAGAVFAPGETVGCAALFFAGALTGVLTAPSVLVAAQYIGCAAAASVAYFMLPRSLALLVPGQVPPEAAGRPALAGASTRLEAVADTLEDIAQVVNQVYEKLPKKGESYDWVVDHVAEDLCSGCGNREECWVSGYSTTVDGFYKLKPVLERDGRASVEQLPGQFCRCVHPAELCASASRAYALFRSRRESRVKAGAMRSALTEQYEAMAGALARIAGELNQSGALEQAKTERVAAFFAALGLEPLEAAVQVDGLGRMKASVTVNRTTFSQAECLEMGQEVARLCHRDFAPPQITHCRTVTTVTFHEQPVYCPRFGLASRPARQGVSGDAADQFCDSFGNAHLLLCDGMGTGKPAAIDGNLAANLTAKLVKAGFGADAAARLVNVALSLKSDEESGATLDLFTVDLYTGRARVFKAGAAPGFVVRQGHADCLEGASLPVGILDEVVGRQQTASLGAGDLAVLLSDGALADGPAWVAQQLELCAAVGNGPQEIADILADMARQRTPASAAPDDITVAVLRLEQAV